MRVYATEEGTGTKHLVALECDDCGAKIKPGPDIAASGWEKRGTYYGPGDKRNSEMILCPVCVMFYSLGRS